MKNKRIRTEFEFLTYRIKASAYIWNSGYVNDLSIRIYEDEKEIQILPDRDTWLLVEETAKEHLLEKQFSPPLNF